MGDNPLLSYIYDTNIYDITSPQSVKSNGTVQQENILKITFPNIVR